MVQIKNVVPLDGHRLEVGLTNGSSVTVDFTAGSAPCGSGF